MRHPDKVEHWPDRIPGVRHLEKVEYRSDRIPDVRHPDKVERWLDRIPEVRRPGGMSENFCLGGMNDATYRKGLSARLRERESCGSF